MVCAENRPHLELTGAWVFTEAKSGTDAGELAGIGPIGVAARSDVDALLVQDADCVIYSPFFIDVDVLCRILESGKNVVTQVGDIFLIDGEKRDRLEAACQAGGVSLYSAGINPGFFSDRLCASLTTLCSAVEHIECCEYSHGPPTGLSPMMLFEGIGFGWTPERLEDELPLLFASKAAKVRRLCIAVITRSRRKPRACTDEWTSDLAPGCRWCGGPADNHRCGRHLTRDLLPLADLPDPQTDQDRSYFPTSSRRRR